MLSGSLCVVTGAGRGIGAHTAATFARNGANLALCARTASELLATREALEALGAQVLVCALDVADDVACADFARQVLDRFGRVDVLVNNAAVQGPVGLLTEVDMDAWKAAVTVNLFGTVNMLRAFLPALRQGGGGRVINLSGGGLGGSATSPRLSAYTASKAAVLSLTETLAKEFAPDGVRINALAPGAINTTFVDGVLAAGPAGAGEDLYAATVRQSAGGDPIENVGRAMLFLASHESGTLTGKLISAKWDPLEALGGNSQAVNAGSLYALRRIDGVLFAEVDRQ